MTRGPKNVRRLRSSTGLVTRDTTTKSTRLVATRRLGEQIALEGRHLGAELARRPASFEHSGAAVRHHAVDETPALAG